MTRLGILYPPAGAEHEYYRHGESLGDGVRIALLGVRIFGDEDEHAPHHLRRTAALDNLDTSARALAPLSPDAAVWACTSGSFIDGLQHAHAQADALAERLRCPATSTSLAFVEALAYLDAERVAVLASYPGATTDAFAGLLEAAGIGIAGTRSLQAPSGPAAARLTRADFADLAREAPRADALLIPDTAVPTLDWLATLEAELDRTVLSANQVSLWACARLAGLCPHRPDLGRLFEHASP